MSGRALGHTGGTIDKLESIAGFTAALESGRFIAQVNDIGLALASQTKNIAPADKKIYALRDVTATVDNVSLIASSILSKKLASGADAIVLDVKCGSGAFMKTRAQAKELAETMIRIGRDMGRTMCAVISNMYSPLGSAVGNALEVNEAVETLRGGGPEDLKALCLTLGAVLMAAGKEAPSEEEAKRRLEQTLANGSAYRKFIEFITAQGGDARLFEGGKTLTIDARAYPVVSPQDGCIEATDCAQVGMEAILSGAGRETKDAAIEPGAGIVLHKKPGDSVSQGELIAEVYARDAEKAAEAVRRLTGAYAYSDAKPQIEPIICEIMR
jgi:pyrimidine-nucleoside phosphorylase